MDADGDPLLELWLAVPVVQELDTSNHSASGQQTIYTNTVVYDDEDHMDSSSFAADIERSVAENMQSYEDYDEWDD